MAQQTAVEWIIQWGKENPVSLQSDYYAAIEHAKAMEKQQRITDYNIGYQDAQCNHINDAENYIYESSSRV